uniref:Uncharacterized protein n=1 Tax=Anoplophora glabripennis TaxID=217634 RepID=V5I9F0_ANOGL
MNEDIVTVGELNELAYDGLENLAGFICHKLNDSTLHSSSTESYSWINHLSEGGLSKSPTFMSCIEVARTRSDAIAEAVLARVEFEYDLVAAEAKYHHDCYVSFLKPSTGSNVGRPKDEATNLAKEEIFTYIENSDDCQFTLNELRNVCKTTALDYRTIQVRLKLKYGDKLIITEKSVASTFICLRDNHDILNQAWYEKKNE